MSHSEYSCHNRDKFLLLATPLLPTTLCPGEIHSLIFTATTKQNSESSPCRRSFIFLEHLHEGNTNYLPTAKLSQELMSLLHFPSAAISHLRDKNSLGPGRFLTPEPRGEFLANQCPGKADNGWQRDLILWDGGSLFPLWTLRQ